MRIWLIRAAALAGALALGAALHALLAPAGYAWVVWALGGLVLAGLVLELALRRLRRRGERADWDRWKAALLDPPARRRAIHELRRAGDRARRLGPRLAVRQARLAVALAELELADGKSDDAVRALSRVDVSLLEPLQAAVVRIARSQAYLHTGDPVSAASALAPLPAETGDAVLDATIRLARGAVALEEGRLEEARGAAAAILEAAEPHDELWDDAQALDAACRAAAGEDHEAPLRAIAPEGRRRLAAVGSARVRRLVSELAP